MPEQAYSAAQAALYLMGNANNHMAQERRKRILLNVNPTLKSMAEEVNTFQKAAPMLFGEEFAKKATDRVEAVKAIKKYHIQNQAKSIKDVFWIPPLESTGWLQGWFQKRPREVSTLPEEHSLIRIKHPRTEKQLETCSVHGIVTNTVYQPTQQVESECIDTILPFIEKGITAPMHAGRIQYFIRNWAHITQDQWVLQGFCLPFTTIPVQSVAPAEMHFPKEQEELISAEVQTLVQKRAVA